MEHNEEIYAYIYVYVDELEIVARVTKTLMCALENRYKFKLKGTEPI